MFYNAIANGGKMIKPFIAKQFLENGKVVKEFEAEVVNPKICKESTLEEIKKMLVGVVENGTAKVVASDYFSIAGKPVQRKSQVEVDIPDIMFRLAVIFLQMSLCIQYLLVCVNQKVFHQGEEWQVWYLKI